MKKNEKILSKLVQINEPNFQHVDCEHSINFKRASFSSLLGRLNADESQKQSELILKKKQNYLEQTIMQAQEQYRMMNQLFQALEKAEGGSITFQMKLKRRCVKELTVRFECPYDGCHKFYSVESTLQRHIKLKHWSIKTQPPLQEAVNQLPLIQNLTPDIYESMENSFPHLCSPQLEKNANLAQ